MPGIITLPPFVTIEHPIELKGKILILQTTRPCMIGQVWKFDTQQKMEEFMHRSKDRRSLALSGYRMLITEYGGIENYDFDDGHVVEVLNEMGLFYYEARIKNYPQGFTRYKK